MESAAIKLENEDFCHNDIKPLLKFTENNFIHEKFDILNIVDLKFDPKSLCIIQKDLCTKECNLKTEYYVKESIGELPIKNEEMDIKTEEMELEK